MRVLISGASVAGPALAYWLARYGFTVTVVERAPALRRTGGHAVDLFRPAMDIVERMGVLEQVLAAKTGTEHLTVRGERGGRPAVLEIGRVMGAVSDRHVEIMRDDLSEIFYDATRHDAEYVFGDSITSISEDGEVTFERGAPARFDLVIGADGLHSNVRRLVFGPESRFTTWIGAYLAVASVPNHLRLDGRMEGVTGVGRLAAMYGAARLPDARALFLFRTPEPLDYHHRDVARQKELLRERFAGVGWEVPRLLAELDRASAFYFDSITQLRLDTWSRGRVTLAGDAGYCPGPAVGGSTSLAVVGAYVLAGELAAHGGDHTRAFPAYEAELGEYVRRSRTFAINAARRLVPGSRLDLWALLKGVRLVNRLPVALTRAAVKLGSKGVRLHDSIALKDYAAPRETTSRP
ncbi:2-polyprenyl-6-methoxyphenol hydroxylase-like FAD-dependent oxidoreductase [Nonomuraea thailandensis]|uniref:2-polyprenyl-6-methoxyphenol hydroxylase-like FAD-dependent oxidoreductase n=1 Tax=Nonomuraea thailandensis TaxID=1188745 RepID=A0A9X2JZ92_9ACTN|nr:FAD-dependent monooxygenase [Nonomuraea thailandensis]MCP2353964.1 2-polyprenyl-6-methoxyphenol hydroxylase-like FAD-dependent oxidoreductase [Nonomuraea thailandensis]